MPDVWHGADVWRPPPASSEARRPSLPRRAGATQRLGGSKGSFFEAGAKRREAGGVLLRAPRCRAGLPEREIGIRERGGERGRGVWGERERVRERKRERERERAIERERSFRSCRFFELPT